MGIRTRDETPPGLPGGVPCVYNLIINLVNAGLV